jgi:hypothetical protein
MNSQLPANVETANTTPKGGGWPVSRVVKLAAAGIIGVILLIFLVGVILALFSNVEQTAPRIQVIRDIFIILLALQGILIVGALAVLILQVARLINLLQNEIMPILRNTQETIDTARGTVQFVGNNLTEPVLKISGFLAALRVLIRELLGIRRAVRPSSGQEEAHD